MPNVASVDRAAAVRAALRRLVAHRGFHGASMSAIAAEAGVATGTAYVHYGSKDELVIAAYIETKVDLGQAAMAEVDPGAAPDERFRAMWIGIHRHLAADPDRARFLIQVEGSPYAVPAHEAFLAKGDDPLTAEAASADIAALLLPLPLEIVWELGVSPAVHLAAAGTKLSRRELETIAGACWRAITRT